MESPSTLWTHAHRSTLRYSFPLSFSLPPPTTNQSNEKHIVGDKIMDWCNNSLVLPRQLLSSHPKMSIDLFTIDLENPLHQEKLWKVKQGNCGRTFPNSILYNLQMCNKVVEWNAKEYDKIKANCQHFLDEVLGVMGIPIPTEGALGRTSPSPFSLALPLIPLIVTV